MLQKEKATWVAMRGGKIGQVLHSETVVEHMKTVLILYYIHTHTRMMHFFPPMNLLITIVDVH